MNAMHAGPTGRHADPFLARRHPKLEASLRCHDFVVKHRNPDVTAPVPGPFAGAFRGFYARPARHVEDVHA